MAALILATAAAFDAGTGGLISPVLPGLLLTTVLSEASKHQNSPFYWYKYIYHILEGNIIFRNCEYRNLYLFHTGQNIWIILPAHILILMIKIFNNSDISRGRFFNRFMSKSVKMGYILIDW